MAESNVAQLKTVSESIREHETFKYYPSLLANTRHNLDTQPVPSAELSTSSDTVLTALAQLGACQTGTARSLISLFDSEFQHVVAEATPTLPLMPSLRLPERGEDLWLCGTAIPRRFGVCEASLLPCDASTREEAENPTLLPLTLVPNLQEDSRFAGSPYCKPGSPAKFYAAVPLRTSRGVNIGVYCVIDTVRRDEWDPALTRVLRNISKTIMEHIEARRSAVASRQGARMNRGIGSFVEGASTISGRPNDEFVNASQDDEPLQHALNADRKDPQQREEDETLVREPERRPEEAQRAPAPAEAPFPDQSPAPASCDAIPRPLTGSSSGFVASHSDATQKRGSELSGNSITSIFAKASNVIREAIEVEGCVFFDARVRTFSGLNTTSLSSGDHDYSKSQPPSDSPSSGQTASMCRVLGFSTTQDSSINGSGPSALRAAIPESFMACLLRRYPNGKIFNFDAKGELRLTDSSEDDSPRAPHGLATEPNTGSNGARGHDYPGAKHREGRAILRIFPDARSVAFVPVRDSGKGRWTAGSFVYTNTPARIFTIGGELSYLTAFGVLAVAETLRLETLQAERAKSDALNSLSHELRSPLHGVVLAAELLHETALTGLQGNILHTIETCGRTLMDTLDHLLDFSKINNFTSKAKRKTAVTSRSRGPRQARRAAIEDGMKSLQSNIAVDCIVEDVVESVFTGYNFQYASLAQLSKSKSGARFADAAANSQMDLHSAVQDFGTNDGAGGHIDLTFSHVFISLFIDPRCTWRFHSQPGALRRIIMNIFGNALKYTQKGTIVVSVRQEDLPATCYDPARQNVIFTVADTGKGIGEDYLRHDVFTPFSQEDPLAAGTGLGLSLVKQITNSLGGSVVVESHLGIGTTVAVKLPMAPAVVEEESPSPSIEDTEFKDHIADLQGLRVLLRGFKDAKGTGKLNKPARHGFSREMTDIICRDWLKMEVVADDSVHTPDIILVTEGAMPDRNLNNSGSPPCVVVCANSLVAFDHATSNPNTQEVFEFISQPLGPRRLAKVLLLACQRQHTLRSSPSPAIEQTTLDLVSKLSVSDELASKADGVETTTTEIFKAASSQMEMTEAPSEYFVPKQTGSDSAVSTTYAASPAAVSVADSATPSPPPNMPAPAAPDLRYLLVDDNTVNLRILSSHVKRLGRSIATARNGLEAYQAFCAAPESFDCVFMDISMPVMDGFEATRRIRAFELEHQLNPTTIIGLSGLASMGAQQEAFISGIDLFLTKPVRLKALEAVLQSRKLL